MAKSDSRKKRPGDDEPVDAKTSSEERDADTEATDETSETADEASETADEASENDADEASEEKAKAPAREGRARAKGRPTPRALPPPPLPVQGGALGKSLLLFVLIIGGLAAAFAIFGQETGGRGAVAWKPGSKTQVEITLVASDKRDLSCWSPQEQNERHCGFEAPAKPWSKGDPNDDKLLLRPYTTVDGVQFLAAGVWSDPALAGNLPLGRFSVKCTFNVEGSFKRPSVRWSSEGSWLDQTNDWMTGHVSGCRLIGATP
ncbi:hypothetical protein [Chondromyces crocatus]|uniref:Uncharacterized protein n=1 Tax=Chondromyces crocatus TaxID=52 RepID=A0A0K1EMD7_CHOCO|nr:hypothetical protein [Chondromyces crocatus]AKT41793.1 uncharacterized protein CMC5_060040 [Chondromyces crocatus]